MERLLVADRGEGPQVGKLTANILNKQLQIVESGWSSSLGGRVGD
jgi:hypothetical protein